MFNVTLSIIILCCGFSIAFSQNANISTIVTDGILNLTLKFLKSFPPQNGNLIFSAFNVYLSLGETELGSFGQTQQQLARAMQIPITSNNLEQMHNAIDTLQENIQSTNPDLTEIRIASGIFTQYGLQLNTTYNSSVSEYYDSVVREVDFAAAPENATSQINEYVSDETNDLIPSLFNEPLPSDTRLVLVNALYFKTGWASAFEESNTQKANFYNGSGIITVDMMNRVDFMPYYYDSALQIKAVSLPYNGSLASLYLIRPCSNCSLQTLIKRITPSDIKRIINGTKTAYVNCSVPRVDNAWSNNINSQIMRLGATRVFTDNAQTNLVLNETLKVDQVVHAAKIRINENGTEAAAATGVSFTTTSVIVDQPKVFNLNRSFLYFIYHVKTNVILFSGIVRNPVDT